MRDIDRVPLYESDPEAWSILRADGIVREVPRGGVLLREGEESDYVALIERGALKVVAAAENGCVAVLAIRRAGEIIGEFAAVENRPRCATVIAVEKSTVAIVSSRKLRTMLESRPKTAILILRNTVARLHEADRRRVEFSSYPVAERISRVLLELAFLFGAGQNGLSMPVEVPLVQQDLAGLVGPHARRLRGCCADYVRSESCVPSGHESSYSDLICWVDTGHPTSTQDCRRQSRACVYWSTDAAGRDRYTW